MYDTQVHNIAVCLGDIINGRQYYNITFHYNILHNHLYIFLQPTTYIRKNENIL